MDRIDESGWLQQRLEFEGGGGSFMAKKIGHGYICDGCGKLFVWDDGPNGSCWYGSILNLEEKGIAGIDVYCSEQCKPRAKQENE